MAKRERKKRHHYPTHPAHPYNWGQSLTVAALWLLACLPYRSGLRLGSALGGAAYYLARERRGIVQRNLELCFPEKSALEREQLARDNFRASGRAVVETALSWFGGAQVTLIPVTVHGEQHLRDAFEENERLILMSGHLMCLELIGRLLPERIAINAMFKPMRKKPVLNRTMLAARQRNLTGATSKDETRALLRSIRDGVPIWYAGDQDYGRKHSVFAPFFGVPAATITALSRMARMGRATVVPMFFFREPDGSYLIEFQPALKGFPSGDEVEDAKRMNEIIEDAVRRYPEQYLWMHRRFKRRQDPNASLYR